MTTLVTIYTDGSCLGNPGNGGWAAILRYGEHEKALSGGFRETTNNRMEVLAAVAALEALKRPCLVELYTDSAYLRNGVTQWIFGWKKNGWRTADKKPVKNQDLWQRLDGAVERHRAAGDVQWRWTKGHAGDEYNERCDQLANGAARQVDALSPVDVRG